MAHACTTRGWLTETLDGFLLFPEKNSAQSTAKKSCLISCLMSSHFQSADNPDALTCKVCNAQYMVEKGSQFSLAQGFTVKQWILTASIVTIMCITLGGCWAVIQLYSEPWIRMLAVGLALLIQYICLR